mmetsp:Transcript_58930/g.111157  ORF Transcript_58930/g.111157 Transcript_58930/m.111157 type:complete len:369 (-) Transcript_58930:80-1186(-)
MNTVREVSKTILKSRTASASVLGSITGGAASVLYTINSTNRFDDLLLAFCLGLFVLIVYLQPDWAVRHAERVLPPDVVFRIPTKERLAALTIDDVPLLKNTTHLEEILDVLLENKVKATFMVMSGFDLEEEQGGMPKAQRDRCNKLLQRAVDEGHELANHLQFDFPAIALEPAAFDKQFQHCDELLAKFAGGKAAWKSRQCRWFRPGSALWNRHILNTAREYGYTTAITNCFPHDVAKVTAYVNADYLIQRARPGAIIVLHDRDHTPGTLRKALPIILAKGLRLDTLSTLHAAADPDAKREAIPIATRQISPPADFGWDANLSSRGTSEITGVDLAGDGQPDVLPDVLEGRGISHLNVDNCSKRPKVE